MTGKENEQRGVERHLQVSEERLGQGRIDHARIFDAALFVDLREGSHQEGVDVLGKDIGDHEANKERDDRPLQTVPQFDEVVD